MASFFFVKSWKNRIFTAVFLTLRSILHRREILIVRKLRELQSTARAAMYLLDLVKNYKSQLQTDPLIPNRLINRTSATSLTIVYCFSVSDRAPIELSNAISPI